MKILSRLLALATMTATGLKVFVSADASGFSGAQAFSTAAFDAATGDCGAGGATVAYHS